MKFFCISDNIDTKIGMRLAGIEGVVIHSKEEVEYYLDKIVKDRDIAIILITKNLVDIANKKIYEIRKNYKIPLITTIPDRHGNSNIDDNIRKYIEDSVGIKI